MILPFLSISSSALPALILMYSFLASFFNFINSNLAAAAFSLRWISLALISDLFCSAFSLRIALSDLIFCFLASAFIFIDELFSIISLFWLSLNSFLALISSFLLISLAKLAALISAFSLASFSLNLNSSNLDFSLSVFLVEAFPLSSSTLVKFSFSSLINKRWASTLACLKESFSFFLRLISAAL